MESPWAYRVLISLLRAARATRAPLFLPTPFARRDRDVDELTLAILLERAKERMWKDVSGVFVHRAPPIADFEAFRLLP